VLVVWLAPADWELAVFSTEEEDGEGGEIGELGGAGAGGARRLRTSLTETSGSEAEETGSPPGGDGGASAGGARRLRTSLTETSGSTAVAAVAETDEPSSLTTQTEKGAPVAGTATETQETPPITGSVDLPISTRWAQIRATHTDPGAAISGAVTDTRRLTQRQTPPPTTPLEEWLPLHPSTPPSFPPPPPPLSPSAAAASSFLLDLASSPWGRDQITFLLHTAGGEVQPALAIHSARRLFHTAEEGYTAGRDDGRDAVWNARFEQGVESCEASAAAEAEAAGGMCPCGISGGTGGGSGARGEDGECLEVRFSIVLPLKDRPRVRVRVNPNTYINRHLYIYSCVYLATYLSIDLPVCLSIYPSIHLSVCLFLYLSIYILYTMGSP